MNPNIIKIQSAIDPIRQQITSHSVYKHIHELEDLQLFMQNHVFAVWDFMSLLKGLQRHLTCVDIPWVPVGNASTRFLINEIVIGEESDTDTEGNTMSHFELYLKAMQQAGANTEQINQFIQLITQKTPVLEALTEVGVSDSIRQFVAFTFEVINTQKPHIMAAVFTFGREDLIPDMFVSMVKDLNQSMPERISIFNYYLERHIEVDGDHHSHLALKMVEELCGDDAEKWQEAEAYSLKSLEVRNQLWSGVEAKVKELTESV
ncbi:DUF3050 domain-containing protein [Arcicella aquatica]|uniref:DUF3050 domain-containing protein n=1 Tax=Arcicella aquatica TaxID=217141 RepID=A0ABU5QPZ1_9BACT|nr:DUF3050 domain-containing protein [Arcicella aquatica]MEA5258471.1 DUF3050 domain-containing protein [Arcicella aquatica]